MYFAFVCETKNDFLAAKFLADSRDVAEKRAKQTAGTVKIHFVGECDVNEEKSHALYEKACKKAESLRDKNKPVAGCNEKTGALF
jgi:hypothetical protein